MIPIPRHDRPAELQASRPNEFGAFSLVSCRPDAPGLPGQSIQYEHLKVQNGQLGLFHTALYQHLSIKGMSLRFYAYAPSAECSLPNHQPYAPSPQTLAENLKKPDFNADTFRVQIQDVIHRLSGIMSPSWDIPKTITVSLPNLGQTMRIDIDRFQCAWLYEGLPQLTIESRRALFEAANNTQIVLRGLVKINTPDQTLSGNHIVWDLNAGQFHVKGRCIYTAGDQATCHRNLVLDTDLNIIGTLPSEKGDALCHAGEAY